MIGAAFLLGLITSLHCVGMCGPIALSLGLNSSQSFGLYAKNITYQLGRISTYSILGLIVGFFGSGFQMAISQQLLSIIAGIIMMSMVFLPKNLSTSIASKNPLTAILFSIKLALGKLLGKSNFQSLYTIGLLNGLLPCGPVYVALTAAIASHTPIEAAFFMGIFGLGTMPLMFLTTLIGNKLSQEFRNKILKLYPVILLILGVLFVLRGLELNIPYLSPSEKSLQIFPKQKCH
jgi:uncharacterized protein